MWSSVFPPACHLRAILPTLVGLCLVFSWQVWQFHGGFSILKHCPRPAVNPPPLNHPSPPPQQWQQSTPPPVTITPPPPTFLIWQCETPPPTRPALTILSAPSLVNPPPPSTLDPLPTQPFPGNVQSSGLWGKRRSVWSIGMIKHHQHELPSLFADSTFNFYSIILAISDVRVGFYSAVWKHQLIIYLIG